jgi:hypothetical protein
MLNNVGFGIVLISPKWEHLEYVPQLQFDGATNNIAKYEALLHDLCIAKSLVIRRHYIDKDFELIKDENGRKRSKTDLRYRKTKMVGSEYFYI